MDKESIIMVLIASAAAGFAFYAVLHELQPVLLATVQMAGIAIIIIVCAGSLCLCLIVIFLFTGNSASTGNLIAFELVEQRRVNKINRLILKEKLAAKREQLRLSELKIIEHTPDIIQEGRYYS